LGEDGLLRDVRLDGRVVVALAVAVVAVVAGDVARDVDALELLELGRGLDVGVHVVQVVESSQRWGRGEGQKDGRWRCRVPKQK
jgi:hypothetical protein